MKHNIQTNGFSLFEILIAFAIIAILSTIAIPTYQRHLTRAHRADAEISLARLAIALEQHYTINNTYKNATLETLRISHPKYYHIELTTLSESDFTISAQPESYQAKKDSECGTLTLNSLGEKKISGSGTINDCW